METGTYLDRYLIRIAGIILRTDLDNPGVNRVLALAEGKRSFYAIPGGKVDSAEIGISRDRLEAFLTNNKDSLFKVMEEENDLNRAFKLNPNRELFKGFDDLIKALDTPKLRDFLYKEITEETGLELPPDGVARSRVAKPYIKGADPFTVYMEKLYSEAGILISPVFILKVAGSNQEVNDAVDKCLKKDEAEIKARKWFAGSEILGRDTSYVHSSLAYVVARLIQQGQMNSSEYSNGTADDYTLDVPTKKKSSNGGSTPGDAKAAGSGK